MTIRAVTWVLLALFLLAVLLLAWAWLAGYTYFLLNKAYPQQVDLSTWYLYWQAYAHDPGQRKRLQLAAVLPALLLALSLVVLAPLFGPRRRPLHGDARWATEREIRDEGLL